MTVDLRFPAHTCPLVCRLSNGATAHPRAAVIRHRPGRHVRCACRPVPAPKSGRADRRSAGRRSSPTIPRHARWQRSSVFPLGGRVGQGPTAGRPESNGRSPPDPRRTGPRARFHSCLACQPGRPGSCREPDQDRARVVALVRPAWPGPGRCKWGRRWVPSSPSEACHSVAHPVTARRFRPVLGNRRSQGRCALKSCWRHCSG